MAKLDQLNYETAKGLFSERRTAAARENAAFYAGDHLQKSNDYGGYIGERPAADATYGDFMARVEKGFISANKVKEFCDRHTNGVLGREPLWRNVFPSVAKDKLTDAQKAIMAEADAALVEMWNSREFLLFMQNVAATALLEEKCAVRPFILPKSRDKNGALLKQKSLTDALKLLRFEVVTSDKGGVFEDEDTFEEFGLYAFEDVKTKTKRAEITYVDQSGITQLKIIDHRDVSEVKQIFRTASGGNYISKAETFGAQTYSLGDLKGRLFLYEFKREMFITEQVRQLQKCLNLDLTMMMRNINLAGFRQKTITNAQKPQVSVRMTDAEGAVQTIKQDVPLRAGLLSTPFLNGLPIYGKDAQQNQVIVGYTNPNINIADPVSVDTFVESLKTFYEMMLAEVYQLHVAIAGDAMASGKSRQEARAEFEKSLMKTKVALDALGRWLIEVSLFFAANLCERREFLDLRCDFGAIVDAGTPDAGERQQNVTEWQAGAISRETMLSRNGVEDTDVETLKISSDDGYQFNLLARAAKAYADAGGSVPFAVFVGQLPIDEAKKAMIIQAMRENAPAPIPPPILQ